MRSNVRGNIFEYPLYDFTGVPAVRLVIGHITNRVNCDWLAYFAVRLVIGHAAHHCALLQVCRITTTPRGASRTRPLFKRG